MKKNNMNQTALKIILVDENMGRSAILRRALQDKGHEVISDIHQKDYIKKDFTMEQPKKKPSTDNFTDVNFEDI